MIAFRCAISGRHFNAQFSKMPGEVQYRLERNNVHSLAEPSSGLLKSDGISPAQTLLGTAGENVSISDFDFTGFACADCGATEKEKSIPFFRCGTCGEYICSGRLVQIDNGQRTVRCHDDCGGGGVLDSFLSDMKSTPLESKDPIDATRPPDSSDSALRGLPNQENSSSQLGLPSPTSLKRV